MSLLEAKTGGKQVSIHRSVAKKRNIVGKNRARDIQSNREGALYLIHEGNAGLEKRWCFKSKAFGLAALTVCGSD